MAFTIADTAASNRASLGLVIGTDVLAPNGSGASLTGMLYLGVGQTWQDKTGSRTLGTTYTNSTGKPIAVNVRCTMTDSSNMVVATVGGVALHGGAASNTNASAITFIVPNSTTYVVTAAGGTLVAWRELTA